MTPYANLSKRTAFGPGFWIRASAVALVMIVTIASVAVARQTTAGAGSGAAPAPAGEGAATGPDISIWQLFSQSFDFFTVLLVIASIAAWAIIVMAVIEVRESRILPPESEEAVRRLAGASAWGELRRFVEQDDAFVSRVVIAGLDAPGDDKDAVREAAELAAGEQCARWFRRIEPLNVIGNLGPLLGLAGTVWGMVIAFAALGQAGGQASPANLSLGVSKALFHTLLGLLLAVPALTVFGFYRTRIDRLCNRAMMLSAALVELLPASGAARRGPAQPVRPAQPGSNTGVNPPAPQGGAR